MFETKSFLQTVTSRPGIYQFFDKCKHLLYVGKARNLKRRLNSYFLRTNKDIKTKKLVEQIHSIEYIETHTENEALILENNLIKKLKPRYNVLFRDDKSYPYIFLSHDEFPRLALHRGVQKQKGHYFGPYPHGLAVRNTIQLLQKIFRIRSCKNTFFKSRTRPCLQYQIKRCSAPCVKLISKTEYAKNINYVRLFLVGKSQKVIEALKKRMQRASEGLQYELAKQIRDQIRALQDIQISQSAKVKAGDVDVIALEQQDNHYGLVVLVIRHGQLLGCKTFFSENPVQNASDILSAFISQYYLSQTHFPKEILLSQKIDDKTILEKALKQQAKKSIRIKFVTRGIRSEWLKMATLNTKRLLESRLNSQTQLIQKFLDFQKMFRLDEIPQRLACFDVSHTMGQSTVAACVILTPEGFSKKDYRRFNINVVTLGDDVEALTQALKRYYLHLENRPDVLIMDGGKGQLNRAQKVLGELQIQDVLLLSVAKGEKRRAGNETIYRAGQKTSVQIDSHKKAFYLIQQIRDEAHRFAITSHRKARQKQQRQSVLNSIPGVGEKRRQLLINHFGGFQGLSRAGVKELAKVPSISQKLAQQIYDVLH